MRAVSPVRLAILSILLLVTALPMHIHSGRSSERIRKVPLRQVFVNIGGWQLLGNFTIDVRTAEDLKLDDYLYQSYGRDNRLVNLYIGYYCTAKNVGAAHDPLVCFQAQGWQISSQKRGEYLIAHTRDLKISYTSMIAQRQDERELIVYWFQSNRKANANSQSQKFSMILDKLAGRSEDNALVRISAPIGEETTEGVRKRVFDFVDTFYPTFQSYMTRD